MSNDTKEKVIPQPDITIPLPLVTSTGAIKGHAGVTFVAGEGVAPSDIMFISPSVSIQEASKYLKSQDGSQGSKVQPRYLRSDAGVMFTDIFDQEGISVHKFYYTALIKWLLPKTERTKLNKDYVAWAMPSLEEEIALVKPKIIVCIGKQVFDLFAGVRLSIADAKGGWFYNAKFNARVYLLEDTYKLVTNPEYIEKFRTDAREINRTYKEINNINVGRIPLDYKTIVNTEGIKELLSIWREGDFKVISVDCEWAGNNHIDGKLRSTQFCWAPGKACYIRWMDDEGNYVFDKSYAEIGKMLSTWLDREDVKYIGHHFAADAPWLHHVLGLNWYEKCIFDTEFAQQTANENEDLSLDRIAMKYTDLGRYDLPLNLWVKQNKAAMVDGGYGVIPDEILIPYACLQGDSLVILGDGSKRKIKDIVNNKYDGYVKAFLNGQVVNCKVTNWYKHRANQKEWYRLQTPTSAYGRWGLMGPVFTPDHKILTSRGLVQVDQLELGVDSIVTDEKQFNRDQLSVVLGSLLGDAGVSQRNNSRSGLLFSQAASRAEYALWKVQVLGSVLPIKTEVDKSGRQICKSQYCRQLHAILERFPRQPSHVNQKRKLVVTSELLDMLGPIGLAVWYQDDGVYTKDGACRIIATKLTDEEIAVAISWFNSRYGSGIKYYSCNTNKFISFSTSASRLFLQEISPYMHSSVRYKAIGYNVGAALHTVDTVPGPAFAEKIINIVPVKNRPSEGDTIRYCISVAEAENFLTEVGFVSNCCDVDAVFRAWPVIRRSLEAQSLTDYYDHIFNPFVTDVFTSFALEGLPMDVQMMDELRVLYTFARDKMAVLLKEEIHADAKLLIFKTFISVAGPGPGITLYNEFLFNISQSDHEAAWNMLKRVAVKPDDVPRLKHLFEHYVDSADFNIRSSTHLKRWLFNVKGYEPIKSTNNKEKGLPSTSWEKVKGLPPEARKNYNPAVDKQTLQILSEQHDDALLRRLLQLNAVGNICKAFLKEADLDEEGNLVKENGLHFFLCSDKKIHGQYSTTETGRPRSWKPNSLNWPSHVNKMISSGIADLFGKIKDRGELPEAFEKYLAKNDKDEYECLVPSIRSCVKAPEGYCFVESDYQTAEIRGLGFISGDSNLIDIICKPDENFALTVDEKKVRLAFPDERTIPRSNQEKYAYLLIDKNDSSLLRNSEGQLVHPKQDLHWSLAEMVHGLPREVLDEKKDRSAAKVGNFSSNYGASASTLERKIEQETGKKPEEGTGDKILQSLERRQPVAHDFLVKMERLPQKSGYYRAASGRIRHFENHGEKYMKQLDEDLLSGMFKSMGREARCFPMQESVAATAARAGKWLLDTYRRKGLKAIPLTILYDSVVTLCPLAERFAVAELHQKYMTDINTWEYHGRKMNYPIDSLFCYRWSAKPSKNEKAQLEDKNWCT